MQKKKEKFLGKVLKRNFNNELEHLLEHKDFDENVKSLLLSMLYKIETAYDDYEEVKKNVIPKEEFLQKILETIENEIESIELVKIGTEKTKKILGDKQFVIDKAKKRIVCIPIEAQLLSAIEAISSNEQIVNDKDLILNESLSKLLNIGNSINVIEPIRDFNGFSWSVVVKDINSLEHNLIYQNICILVGNQFLYEWIQNKDKDLDYFEMFKNKLKEEYGELNKNELVSDILALSILLQLKNKSENLSKIINLKRKVEKNLKEIENVEGFTIKLTREKKKINMQIKTMDTIISDKNLLKSEYIKRNAQLPLEEKIFSVRVLANMIKEERQALVEKKRKINKMLNPQEFIRYRESLEERYKYLRLINIEDTEKNLKNQIIILQKVFLGAFYIKVEKANTKEELYNLIREFRYYLNIPVNKTKRIGDLTSIASLINQTQNKLINKSIENKLIPKLFKNEEQNYLILKEIINTKIINLDGVSIEISSENEIVNLQIFDENIFEKKVEIHNLDIKDIEVKANKTIKVFNM